MTSLRLALLVSASIALPFASPALAQEASSPPTRQSPPDRTEPGSDDFHGTIVVTAAGLDRLDVLAGTSVIEGVELQRNLDAQIG
jgi:iron complex outermembrane receptor protein